MHVWGGQEGDEGWDGTSLHHRLGVVRVASSNVSQCPGCLKLQRSIVSTGQELNQPGDDPQIDDLIDGGFFLPGQHSPARKDITQ